MEILYGILALGVAYALFILIVRAFLAIIGAHPFTDNYED